MSLNRLHLLLLVGLLVGCKKDAPPTSGNHPAVSGAGVYISNEGNFQFGNAAVSYFEEGFADAIPDLFAPANNRPLGDVLQSMYFTTDLCYLVVNNSGKVEVVNAQTFKSVATITGFSSPRYFLPVGNGKAYVTDLYAGALSIVDLSTHQKVGEIPCPARTEELALAQGEVFVTSPSTNFILIVQPQTDAVVDSIVVGYGAHSIRQDAAGKLWVLCSGNAGSAATLHRVDPVSHAVETTLTFPAGQTPGNLNVNGTGDTLYYLNNGVFQLPVAANSLPTTPFIPTDGRNFYSLGVHPATGDVYVADALDYVQRGKVYVYSGQGQLKYSFLAGIIPGGMYVR